MPRGALIAVEGIDGAGKRTLAAGLAAEWRRGGLTVAEVAYPRYGESVHADLGAEALRGGHGDLVDSVYGMALMWALDRRADRERLRALAAENDVVLLDRYAASNAAYGAARLGSAPDGAARSAVARWVHRVEFGRFGLPLPHRQVLLSVPVGVARERAVQRELRDESRTRDAYESDDGLQQRVASAYAGLAEAGWAAPWEIVDGGEPGVPADGSLAELAHRLLRADGA